MAGRLRRSDASRNTDALIVDPMMGSGPTILEGARIQSLIVKDTTVDGAEQTAGESLDEREQRDTQVSANQPEIREHVQQSVAACRRLTRR